MISLQDASRMRSKDLLPPRFLMNQDMLIGMRIKAEIEMPSLTQVPDSDTDNAVTKLWKQNEKMEFFL